MANNNGHKTAVTESEQSGQENRPAGMLRHIRQPLFERDLLAAALELQEAFTKTHFDAEVQNIGASMYVAHMLRWNARGKFDVPIQAALLRLNGNRAVKSRATKFAVQGHGNLYFDPDASKEDKKIMAEMQKRKDRGNDDNDENEHRG